MNRLIDPFLKFADFSGRSPRGEFWYFAAASAAITYGLAALDNFLFGPNVYALSVGYFLLAFIPLFSLTMRRLRDAGRGEYWIFLLVLGLPGLAALLFLLAGESVPPRRESGAPESAGVDVVKTLTALFCYSVTLYWIYSLGAESARCGSPAWVQFAVMGFPFLYLITRLYTRRDEPWPGGSGAVLTLYASAILLVAISAPYFSGLVQKSTEGATKNKLAVMRAALDNAREPGVTPDIRRVIPSPQLLKLPGTGHPPADEIRVATFTDIQDTGRWLFDGTSIYIDCTHADSRGVSWSAY